MNKMITCELTDGPHKGRTVLGRRILERVGPQRWSIFNLAFAKAAEIDLNHGIETEVLEENREVRGRPLGPVFFVAINNQKERERE